MANYQESDIAGTKYTRAYQVHVQNGMAAKAITFHEEEVINLADEVIQRKKGSVTAPFTSDNASTEFALVDPTTGADSGQAMSYQDVYVALYSLYLHLAAQRDAQADSDATDG